MSVLRKVVVLAGFVIGGHNLNNMKDVLMTDTERKTLIQGIKWKREERTNH